LGFVLWLLGLWASERARSPRALLGSRVGAPIRYGMGCVAGALFGVATRWRFSAPKMKSSFILILCTLVGPLSLNFEDCLANDTLLTFLLNACKFITYSLKKAMKTLQVRISDDLRLDADAVLNEIGLDMPTAIRLYLNKIVQTRSIPFSLEAPNGVFVEAIGVDASTQKKMDSVASAWRKAKV
jgi:DNA-damage-inducible protein J